MPNCKREVSLKHFLRKLKRKSTFFNENEYGGLSPSGSAPTLICGTTKILKMHKCFSSDSIKYSTRLTFFTFITRKN